MRTVGVEEELLLVGTDSGRAVARATQVLRRAEVLAGSRSSGISAAASSTPGSSIDGELQREQVETDTAPHHDMTALGEELLEWRVRADSAARREGTRAVALATSPLPAEPSAADDERYQRIVERYGQIGREQLICGCHVHVSVDSDDEAIGALDRARVWLPTLLALSANSPFWQGGDSGYASYRPEVMIRWPVAGPPDVFGSAAAYRRRIEEMMATGVILDEGMVYLDARPSRSYPTLELRVADVCQDARDTVLLAALSRALVETAAGQWASGDPAPDVPTQMLRLATWQASRYGTGGELLDPFTHRPRPAGEVLDLLVAHVRPALEGYGDTELVLDGLARLQRVGTGADRQRRVLERTGSLHDVVQAAVRMTLGQEGEG
ncbi:glutamate--cysteine ligase [Georgenia sp. 311]|uniref:glutamate--cysteine ligase 2 n=1 Tax=Georgenia sp. 311 TaxID=2585134 RepID=UPI001111CA76|nr:glutamate--cysteine ligase [Georgenia sp. 311]TNC19098.1 glutamate--cysteine ligase [Georgenia sp. 311]